MKMKIGYLALLSLSASLPVAAADMSGYLGPITAATAQIDQCTLIVTQITALKVPPKQAEARHVFHINETIADPKKKLPIDPVNLKFHQDIVAGRAALQACGVKYQQATKPIEGLVTKFVDATEKKQINDADGKQVAAALDKYHQEHQKLTVAVDALSNDKVVQSQMHQVLLTYFFNK